MALGAPSITTPRSGERELASIVGNIRERIESIERELLSLKAGVSARTVDASSVDSAIRAALQEIASIRRRVGDLESSSPVTVRVDGVLVGTRKVIDFRAVGAIVSGQLLEDRVVVTVAVGSFVLEASPAMIDVAGLEATFA